MSTPVLPPTHLRCFDRRFREFIFWTAIAPEWHQKTADDLFDSKPKPEDGVSGYRCRSMSEWIMKKIDNVFRKWTRGSVATGP
jgi:hypothetical protein